MILTIKSLMLHERRAEVIKRYCITLVLAPVGVEQY